ncbi:MAG: hypothetical protein ACRDR6_16400 [Pseudonocardiaceae bacterium]
MHRAAQIATERGRDESCTAASNRALEERTRGFARQQALAAHVERFPADRPRLAAVALDNEAAQALSSSRARDPRRASVVAAIMAANGRVVVPTAVRVEASWRRRDPAAAEANTSDVPDISALATHAEARITVVAL